jgi:hypothetical protein
MAKINIEQLSAILIGKTAATAESNIMKLRGTITIAPTKVSDEVTRRLQKEMQECLVNNARNASIEHVTAYRAKEAELAAYQLSKKRYKFTCDKLLKVVPTAVYQADPNKGREGLTPMPAFETRFFEFEQDMVKEGVLKIATTNKEGVFDIEWDNGQFPLDSTNYSILPVLRLLSAQAMMSQGRAMSALRSYAERALSYNKSLGNMTGK